MLKKKIKHIADLETRAKQALTQGCHWYKYMEEWEVSICTITGK